MSEIKVEVLQKFRDAHTGALHLPGEVLEITSERLAEIMAVNVQLVKVFDQAPAPDDNGAGDDAETEPPAEGDDAEGTDAADESDTVTAPPAEDNAGDDADDEVESEPPAEDEKPKAKHNRKPAAKN